MVPVGAVPGDRVKETTGGASEIMLVAEAVENRPALSIAVTLTVNVPEET